MFFKAVVVFEGGMYLPDTAADGSLGPTMSLMVLCLMIRQEDLSTSLPITVAEKARPAVSSGCVQFTIIQIRRLF